jgi:ubiquinone/menaquinone biosynthesis C-methylase UbiE
MTERDLYQKYVIADDKASSWQLEAWKLDKIRTFNIIKKHEITLKGKNILNLGCGRDILFRYFAWEGATAVDCDLVTEALREIKSEGAENVLTCDVFKLPFKSENFDVVFCIGVLHHLHPIELALSEMVRVLKKGGKIYCIEPSKDYLPTMLIEATGTSFTFKLREKVLPVFFKKYSPPAQYERTLSSKEMKNTLQRLTSHNVLELFNTAPHFVVPKSLALFQYPVTKLLAKLPSLFQKYFAFEFTVIGER